MDATCLGLHGSERSTVPRGRRSIMGVGWGALEHSGRTLFSGVCRRRPDFGSRPHPGLPASGAKGRAAGAPGRRAGGGEGAGTKAAATAPRSDRAATNSGGRAGTRDSRDVAARGDEAPQPRVSSSGGRGPAARTAPSGPPAPSPAPAPAPSPPPRGGRGGSALGEHGGGGGRAGHFT